MPELTLDGQIACVLRELALRRKVYPRRCALNKMTQAQAEHELKAMEAVYRSLCTFQEHTQEQRQMFPTQTPETSHA